MHKITADPLNLQWNTGMPISNATGRVTGDNSGVCEIVVKLRTSAAVREAVSMLASHGSKMPHLRSRIRGRLTSLLADSQLRSMLHQSTVQSLRPLFCGPDPVIDKGAASDPQVQARSLESALHDAHDASLKRLSGYCVLQVPARRYVARILERLAGDFMVEFAHPASPRLAQQAPDPLSNLQWGLAATRLIAAHQSNVIQPDEHGIAIAVIDSGVATESGSISHPDLVNVVKRVNFTTEDSRDLTGHGTHLAGIIGAISNNGVGTTGYCRPKSILALKALTGDPGASSISSYYSALRYAIDQGTSPDHPDTVGRVRVINLSVGGEFQQTEQVLIREAVRRGIVVVAAMGNYDSSEPLYPAALSEVIAVGASNSAGERWVSQSGSIGSNTGAHISLVAPGQSILSTVPTYPTFQRFSPTGYAELDGTSMSTAFVSAAAALLLARRPAATPDQIRRALELGATPLHRQTGHTHELGHGQLNIEQSLQEIRNLVPL